ncbi:acyltransferase domain-containing protein [Mycobacterium sp. PDNC021]|uniref:acyltransferase domain-containing protein n=1 Tax=Mycobacterium sp. PDNC021 TaxID=3391399 RepID=UPI003AABC4DB
MTTALVSPAVPAAVLVFPGQGSQWAGMATELLDAEPVFAARLRECDSAISEFADWSVEDVLRRRPGARGLDRVEVVQPALFSVHVALAELWQSRGLQVRAVVGQSQGEVAAACVAGALTVQDAARVIVGRSQLFADHLVGLGGIASVDLPAAELEPLLVPYAGALELAGVIGPHTATAAGAATALANLTAHLIELGITAKVVPASIPSHCAFIEPLRARLGALLSGIHPRDAHLPIYSTTVGGPVTGTELDAAYWYQNARRPVLFEPVIRRLLVEGERVFIESSAHPVLTAAVSDTAARAGAAAVVTGTLRRGQGGAAQFESALASVLPDYAHDDGRVARLPMCARR